MYCKYTVLFCLCQYYGSLGTWHALLGLLKPSLASSTYISVYAVKNVYQLPAFQTQVSINHVTL